MDVPDDNPEHIEDKKKKRQTVLDDKVIVAQDRYIHAMEKELESANAALAIQAKLISSLHSLLRQYGVDLEPEVDNG